MVFSSDHRRVARRLTVERLESRQLLAADLIISEFMALNTDSLLDEDQESSDWIELHNRGDMPASLDEFYLTDDPGELDKWRLPDALLVPDDYAVVFASGKDRAMGELHANFKLAAGGEYLGLARFNGTSFEIVHQFAPEFPRQFADVSYGIGREITVQRLIEPGAGATYLVPDGPPTSDWTGGAEPFDDSAWSTGTTGIGFDNDQAEPVIPATDTFSRPDNTNLGVTEGGGFAYVEAGTVTGLGEAARILGGELEVFGVEGIGGRAPGVVSINASFADVEIAVDMRFGGISDPTNPGTNNNGGFFLRRPAPDANFNSGESQVEVAMYPGGGFLIRETHNGVLNTLYSSSPFPGGSTNHLYSTPGTLPAMIGGLPFDVDEDGVLEADEPFRLGGTLAGDQMAVSINGEVLINLTVSRSAPSSATSLTALYKNRATSAGGLDAAQPTFDNLFLTGATTVPELPPDAALFTHTGDTNPAAEGWQAFDGGAGVANNGPVNDGGVLAWNIQDTSSVGGSRAAFVKSLNTQQITNARNEGWRMKGRLRFLGTDDNPDGAVELSAYLDSTVGFVLWFGADASGNPIVGGLTGSLSAGTLGIGPTATVSGSGYHDYEMVFDPVTELVDVFVDGDPNPVITNYGGVDLDTIAPLNRILWGSNDSLGQGNANYELIEFETFTRPPILHAGDNDPVRDEGWQAFASGTIAHNGPADDGNTPAWNLDDDGGARAAFTRTPSQSQLEAMATEGWTLDATLSVIDRNDEPDGAIELSLFPDSNKGYALWFGSNAAGDALMAPLMGTQSQGNVAPGPAVVVPGSGYHDYRIVFDPETETVEVFVDAAATPALAGYDGVDLDVSGPLNRVLWGSNASNGIGESNWTAVSFQTGVPPETLLRLVQTNVESQMFDVNPSSFIRIPFEVEDPTTALTTLRMRYDDGFVAYVNGVEVARAGTPTELAWNSTATASRTDEEVLQFMDFGIVAASAGLLHVGTNILAIHGLNSDVASSDFLILPELIGVRTVGDVDLERYFTTPTPAAPNNSDGPVGFVEDTAFSVDRGFYEDPMEVTITTPTTDATIVYTLDGSAPAADTSGGNVEVVNGTIYSGPIGIATTTTLRAAAFKPRLAPTNVDTQTYIFLADVIRQNGAGLSETWGTFPTSISIGGTPWQVGQPVPSDWAMDQNIVDDPAYRDQIIDDLKAVPTISLSMDPDDLFGDNGIYINPLQRGSEWEQPVSIEYFDPQSAAEFQLNAGVRIHGGASRRPDQTRKHSLRLKFREIYDGNSKLDFPFFAGVPFGDSAVESFDTLILRGSYSDGFSVGDLSWSPINLRDQWARDAQLATGQPSPHSKYVHVYINGFYWGLYNATERIEGSFVEAYLGGDKDNADVITDDGLNEGDTVAWNQALSLASGDLSTPAAYAALQELIDVDSLIDYMLVQMHAGNWDWPQNNWLALRDRDGVFHFPVWDVEVGLGAARNASGHDLTRNQTGVSNGGTPAQLYSALRANDEFRLLFADHIQRHFFHGGSFSPEGGAALFQARVDEVYNAIVAETARWGDHNGIDGTTANLPYQRDGEWAAEIDWILNTWFPQRTQVVLDQFRAIDLYPDTEAATFQINGRDQHGGVVNTGDALSMVAPAGSIWYSLDGSDPRLPAEVDPTEIQIVTADTSARALVPSVENRGDQLGSAWWGGAEPFDDSTAAGWSHGTNGVGYDRGAGGDYEDRIAIDVEQEMDGVNGSVFVRIPFTLDAGFFDNFGSLKLRMEYDDGFVAYINGVEVARANFDDAIPQWNSTSSGSHESFGFLNFDISQHLNTLHQGENILAIHGLNRSQTSSDMLVLAELVAGEGGGGADISPSAIRFDGTPIPLRETTRVKTRVFSNDQWSALSAATFVLQPPPVPNVAISEINYNPHAPTLAELAVTPTLDNDDFEFIELANVHPTEHVNVGGFSLTAGVEFTFPLFSLAPGERAVVVEDASAFRQRYGNDVTVLGQWAGALSNNGERLVLTDGTGNVMLNFEYRDADPWPQRADGDGGTLELTDPGNTPAAEFGKHYRWRGSADFGGSPGIAGAEPSGIVINEVLARTDPPTPRTDAVELLNTTSATVDLSGWFLSDSANDFFKFEIPAGTTLAAGQYLVFDESDFNASAGGGARDFALSGAQGDDVWLVIPDGAGGIASFVDDVHFGASANGETFGRIPDGMGRLAPMRFVTLGRANSQPRIGPLVISEVHYNPGPPSPAALAVDPNVTSDDLEFVEIHNTTATSVDLTHWRIRGGVDFDFAAGTAIGPAETLVVVSFNVDNDNNADRLAALRAHFGLDESVALLGGFTGQLSDNGERVQLQRPGDPPIDNPLLIPRLHEDEILYDNIVPWDSGANGTGDSLRRRGSALSGNFANGWEAAQPSPGSVDFGLSQPGDLTRDGAVDADDIDALFAALHIGNASAEFDVDGSGAVDQQDVTFLVESILGTFMGDADLDGRVDAADLNRVGLNWQSTHGAGWEQGNFNGGANVNAQDLNVLALNWQQPSQKNAAAHHRAPRAPLAARVSPSVILADTGRKTEQSLTLFWHDFVLAKWVEAYHAGIAKTESDCGFHAMPVGMTTRSDISFRHHVSSGAQPLQHVRFLLPDHRELLRDHDDDLLNLIARPTRRF